MILRSKTAIPVLLRVGFKKQMFGIPRTRSVNSGRNMDENQHFEVVKKKVFA